MELIAVNHHKLKAIVSGEELAEYDIEAEELDYSNARTRLLLKDLLNRAKRELGFDTGGERVLIQLFPSKHDGCEIYVTVIGDSSCRGDYENESKEEGDDLELRDIEYTSDEKNILLSFGSAEALIGFCRWLVSRGYTSKSSAYCEEKGEGERIFYLFITSLPDLSPQVTQRFTPSCFAWEFGSPESSEFKKRTVAERSRSIVLEGAVEKLAAL